MSLVICSNQESDATTVGRNQSINKPYSFRNGLSSTMMLPKNCQVALESVKYNLDGTIAISGDSYIMYFYYGETLTFTENMDHSTAVPVRIPLIDVPAGVVKELTFTELVQEIQNQLNKFVFHPNLRDLVTCSVVRDGSTDELQGIQIDFGQYSGTTSAIPVSTKEFGSPSLIGEDAGWVYENASFLTTATSIDNTVPAVALLSDKPISLNEGELIVDFSDANDANVEWRVGLSRFVPKDKDADPNAFAPLYMSSRGSAQEDMGPQPGLSFENGLMFADFLVCRVGNLLKVCHTAVNSNFTPKPTWVDVIMDQGAVGDDYDLATNSANYTKVKFKCRGQQIKLFMLEADDTEHVLYEYDSAQDADRLLKPVNQSCWTMYPVLSIDRTATVNGNKLIVETFIGCDNISSPNIDDINNSWYQSVQTTEGIYGDTGVARELETRPWNDEQEDKASFNIQAGINASGAIELPVSLITQPSGLYKPTDGANTKDLLAFPSAKMNGVYLAAPAASNTLRIQSTSGKAPRLFSTKTMFVRLENFTQNCINSLQGNRSKIIAHLPRFDGQIETGRIFHSPAERVYLDLNNSEPLRVNSFDISFCYTNEQYATNLTGQSVVVLHFKQKDS
tara:strand:- start:376 stop:2238 length:1863 start_codon:yes stop_codon:yes gene_type:complete